MTTASSGDSTLSATDEYPRRPRVKQFSLSNSYGWGDMILAGGEDDDERAAASAGDVLGLKQLQQKLGIASRHRVAVVNAPPELRLRLLTAASLNPDRADVVIGFATRPVDLAWLKPVYAAARTGRPAWVSYPPPGRRGTDLRRDWLVRAVHQYGVAPVQDVSIDHAWSAMRLHRIDHDQPAPEDGV